MQRGRGIGACPPWRQQTLAMRYTWIGDSLAQSPPEAVLGRAAGSSPAPDLDAAIREAPARALRTEIAPRGPTSPSRCPAAVASRVFDLLKACRDAYARRGRVVGTVCSAIDVTERRRVQSGTRGSAVQAAAIWRTFRMRSKPERVAIARRPTTRSARSSADCACLAALAQDLLRRCRHCPRASRSALTGDLVASARAIGAPAGFHPCSTTWGEPRARPLVPEGNGAEPARPDGEFAHPADWRPGAAGRTPHRCVGAGALPTSRHARTTRDACQTGGAALLAPAVTDDGRGGMAGLRAAGRWDGGPGAYRCARTRAAPPWQQHVRSQQRTKRHLGGRASVPGRKRAHEVPVAPCRRPRGGAHRPPNDRAHARYRGRGWGAADGAAAFAPGANRSAAAMLLDMALPEMERLSAGAGGVRAAGITLRCCSIRCTRPRSTRFMRSRGAEFHDVKDADAAALLRVAQGRARRPGLRGAAASGEGAIRRPPAIAAALSRRGGRVMRGLVSSSPDPRSPNASAQAPERHHLPAPRARQAGRDSNADDRAGLAFPVTSERCRVAFPSSLEGNIDRRRNVTLKTATVSDSSCQHHAEGAEPGDIGHEDPTSGR